jgi:mannobiose 2-epimerase
MIKMIKQTVIAGGLPSVIDKTMENGFCCVYHLFHHVRILMLLVPNHREDLCASTSHHLVAHLLEQWYPQVLDIDCGGYFTHPTCDREINPGEDKRLLSQAQHLWTMSEAASFLPEERNYSAYARHGFAFLKKHMWDDECGGFFHIRSREGGYTECNGWRQEKRAGGNAVALLALARFYRLTQDPSALDLAKKAFQWLEAHAFDPVDGGYFPFLTREGVVIGKSRPDRCQADDRQEYGYKDLNSSIHLLEAYTELHRVWKDRTLKAQLTSLLGLIRDTMVTAQGYLRLFFRQDWAPVSFRDAPSKTRSQHHALNHVSFGHDCQTAFLLLEASYTLGLVNDARTLLTAQRLLEHSIVNGWDQHCGGFFDGGYYQDDSSHCTIVRSTKAWWSQADALNALLLFSHIFPSDRCYRELYEKQWELVDASLTEHLLGNRCENGSDHEPDNNTAPDSRMWEFTNHTSRVLMNCIALMSDKMQRNTGVLERKHTLQELVNHWKRM